MVFGGFVAGSTPQGGGAVAFPVFTKVLETPSEVARSMGLFIQVVGMGCASIAIIVRKAPVAWRAVGLVLVPALVGLAVAVVAASRLDQPFAPSVLPGAWVKVTFTVLIVAMAVSIFAMSRRPVRERRRSLGNLSVRAKALIIGAGLLGGFLSGLTGSGVDVLFFTVLVLLLGLDPRIGVPSSVITMATISAVALVGLGLAGGHLFVELDDSRSSVVSVSGETVAIVDGVLVVDPPPTAGPAPPQQYDLTGLWLAGIPAAAWAGPLGAKLAMRLSDRNLAWLVAGLAFAEMISTAIFLDALRTDLALVAYFVLGIVGAVLGLRWVSAHRIRLFGLEAWDTSRPVTRMSVITTGSFSSWAQGPLEDREDPEAP
nr:TSUP family transporter [Rhabdothermincola salaria]